MKAEVTAIIEPAPEGGYWAVSPEFPGANGQGETIGEARESLRLAINLLIEDRLEDAFRGLSSNVIPLWMNPKTSIIEAILTHGEIKEGLAKKILKNLDNPGSLP